MSSIITGLGSGMDINSWITQLVAAKQASLVTPLQTKLSGLQSKSNALTSLKSKFSSLQTALQTFSKTIYNSSSDMWTNTTINSSNEAYATAVSSGVVSASNIQLKVEQIATATIAKSADTLGKVTAENAKDVKFTNLANGLAKEGSFSMFLNGKRYSIDIEADDTLQTVMDKINNVSDGKIQAKIDESGNFSIKAHKQGDLEGSWVEDTDAQLTLGSGADESNLASALKLHEKTGDYGYSSSYSLSPVNTSAAITSAESGLAGVRFFDGDGEAQNGTITINGVDFAIDKDTTLDTLISRINGNSDVKVKASYDSLTNRFVLTSSETGQNNISLSEEGTNLLNVLGLTSGSGDDEILAQGSQTLGQNAIVHINGNRVVSASNTITGESSGITNLSITVKKLTADYSGNSDDEDVISLDIEPDTTKVKEALTAFVDAYNDVYTSTKNLTASDGAIGRDSVLNSTLSKLRSIVFGTSENNGTYSLLADIGVSVSSSDITKLTIDDEKLDKALKENLESVKLLLSDGYTGKEDNGIFDELLANVNTVLDIENGYFANLSDSVQSKITSMNNRITRANRTLSKYEERITKQFNAMDAAIASLNSQLSTFQTYI